MLYVFIEVWSKRMMFVHVVTEVEAHLALRFVTDLC